MMCPEPRLYLIFKRSMPYAQLLRSAGLLAPNSVRCGHGDSRKRDRVTRQL